MIDSCVTIDVQILWESEERPGRSNWREVEVEEQQGHRVLGLHCDPQRILGWETVSWIQTRQPPFAAPLSAEREYGPTQRGTGLGDERCHFKGGPGICSNRRHVGRDSENTGGRGQTLIMTDKGGHGTDVRNYHRNGKQGDDCTLWLGESRNSARTAIFLCCAWTR